MDGSSGEESSADSHQVIAILRNKWVGYVEIGERILKIKHFNSSGIFKIS